MTKNKSRYSAVTRRRFIQTSVLGGLAALVPGVACSTGTPAAVPATDPSSTGSSQSTIAPGSTAPSEDPSTTEAGGASGAVAGEMVVGFTYLASDSGRVHSPYIAVWIEDAAGDLVRTVSLWYKSDERKYLSDLRSFRRTAGNNTDAVVSGATRLPGSYSVVWDATTPDGTPVPAGDYHICIEAAREDGPYELIREAITLDGSAFSLVLPDDGELTKASVEFRV